jgi:tRNA dimethylallyltransferase
LWRDRVLFFRAHRRTWESTPLNDLLGELESKDPETFAVVDRQNPRRVVRAVEVIRLTGRKYSELRAEWGDTHAVRPDWHWIGLHRASEDLHERISRRVDQMFAGGLVAETERLRPEGLEQNKTAMQAIGYRQVVEYLRGIRSLAETAELVKLRTRQFAKRQMTWFRKYLPLNWIEIEPSESLKDLSNRVKPSQSPSSS